MRKLLLTAALFAGTLGFSVPAVAAPLIVTNVQMSTPPDVVNLIGGAFNGSVYMGPTTLTFSGGSSVLVYCVDILHGISLGPTSLAYHTDTLANFLTAQGYSSLQQQQIAGLVFTGLSMAFGPNMNPVEGGIWQKLGGTVTTGNGPLQAQINAYGSSVFTYDPSKITMYIADNGTQSFAGLAVPEPMTWILLIGGFGAIAFAIRRRPAQTNGELQAA